MRTLILLLIASFSLIGCSTTPGNLKYSPTVAAKNSSASNISVAVGSFADNRQISSTWLGSIRSGFGSSLKTLNAERPISEIVRNAFVDGLHERGVATDGKTSKLILFGAIKTLYVDQYVRKGSKVEIEVSIMDEYKKIRFSRMYSTYNEKEPTSIFDSGAGASIENLRILLEQTLSETVDQVLTDSDLNAALQL